MKPVHIYLILMSLFFLLIVSTPFIYMYSPPIGAVMYSIFSPFCHQITERSLCVYPNLGYIADCTGGEAYKFPVCSRCLAFYAGMLIGGIVYWFANRKGYTFSKLPLWILILLILPMAVDGSLQYLGFWGSTNMIRMLTGFPAGFVVPFYLLSILEEIKRKRKDKKGTNRKNN